MPGTFQQAPKAMPDRTRARQLAAEYLAKGDPTGWFEQLYREGEAGKTVVPWVELRPNPKLVEFWGRHLLDVRDKRAIEIGCGVGDDAEQLAQWGFDTTAFDVSETAIQRCRRRFPQSRVAYVTADLLQPPAEWSHAFDFVLDVNTFQVLPPNAREVAMRHAARFVKERGHLLVIARARDENDPTGEMPWPLTRRELSRFTELGLHEESLEEYLDDESPPVRRFQALYFRP